MGRAQSLRRGRPEGLGEAPAPCPPEVVAKSLHISLEGQHSYVPRPTQASMVLPSLCPSAGACVFPLGGGPHYAVELGSNVSGSLRPRRPGRGVWTRTCHGGPPLFGKQLSSWTQSPHLTGLRIRLLSSAPVSFFSQVSFPGGITVSSANAISPAPGVRKPWGLLEPRRNWMKGCSRESWLVLGFASSLFSLNTDMSHAWEPCPPEVSSLGQKPVVRTISGTCVTKATDLGWGRRSARVGVEKPRFPGPNPRGSG